MKKISRIAVITVAAAIICAAVFFVYGRYSAAVTAERDAFINNPFAFTILKQYIDDYSTIGTVVT